MQNGFELPSRLSVSAADCFISLTEALTKKPKVSSDSQKSSNSEASDRPVIFMPSASEEKKVKPTNEFSELSNVDKGFLLWDYLEDLAVLVQRLLAVCSLLVICLMCLVYIVPWLFDRGCVLNIL